MGLPFFALGTSPRSTALRCPLSACYRTVKRLLVDDGSFNFLIEEFPQVNFLLKQIDELTKFT